MAAETRSLATEVTTDAFHGVTAVTWSPPTTRGSDRHRRRLRRRRGQNCRRPDFHHDDGLALDTIFVSRAFELDADELRRGQRIASNIEKTLRGEVRLAKSRRPGSRATSAEAHSRSNRK